MKKTMGALIAQLRKEKGMTQLELAQQMGVTDKAVSKWERDLSCPDISTIPHLAEVLGVSVEELMQSKAQEPPQHPDVAQLVNTACKGVALAMGVAVVVLTVLQALTPTAGMAMLGVGLACLALALMEEKS